MNLFNQTYDSIDQMFYSACKAIEKFGIDLPSRDGGCKEITGYSARLMNPCSNFLVNPSRRLNPSYAAAEFLWYLSGSNKISLIESYAPQYKRFTEDGVTAWGSYGYRWNHDSSFVQECLKNNDKFNFDIDNFMKTDTLLSPISQLQAVAWLLKKDPNIRQAVITMWNAGDLIHALLADKKDLPCTMCLNFLVREGKLNLTATMRSNDIWLGFPYDIWCFTNIQILLADILGLEVGWYQHQANSLHVYERNLDKFKEVCNFSFPIETPEFDYKPCSKEIKLSETIKKVLQEERRVAFTKAYDYPETIKQSIELNTLLGQCLTMTALKWDPVVAKNYLKNPELRRYVIRR